MLLWIGFAILTAAVIGAVARPLLRAQTSDASSAEPDLAVYRDQLAEIEADRRRGLIGTAEAEAARVEVARRLLARAGDAQVSPRETASARRPAGAAVWALAAVVPLASVGLYLAVGSPWLPARPHAERGNAPVAEAPVTDLIAKVEARLREHPEDGQGWDVIAPVYLRLQRYADAAEAFTRAMRILGETPRRLAGFAEATVLAADGIVSEEARRAYEKVLAAEPGRHDARFWLAVAKEQDGDLQAALAAYATLLERAPSDAVWRAAIAERVAELKKRAAPGEAANEDGAGAREAPAGAIASPSGTPRWSGPDPDAQSAEMGPEARVAFVTRMVETLAERLKSNGKDLGGWLRLMRAYSVLGRKAEAAAALSEARRNFATDTASLAEIDALAKTLGLES
jgi:cytochrome c-type biogenesis protein CcmH